MTLPGRRGACAQGAEPRPARGPAARRGAWRGAAALAAWLAAAGAVGAAPRTAVPTPQRDLYADTWVATDGLGRTLPVFEQTGPPRAGRTAAIFYFLWLGQHSRTGPWDITKILAERPEAKRDSSNPAWGPMGHFHFWGEPLFGYYVSDDPWAIRKHAALLQAAGVDALITDNTNNFTYDRCWQAVGSSLTALRQAGNPTPTFAFLAPFGDANRVVRSVYSSLYTRGLFKDLWFRWGGKPLMLANASTVRDEGAGSPNHDQAVRLEPGASLAQTFTSATPVAAVGASLPTWSSPGSGATLTLRRDGPGGPVVAARRAAGVADNAWVMLELPAPEPAGVYCLELSEPVGTIGWWHSTKPTLSGAQAFADGRPVEGTRCISVLSARGDASAIRDFFTFRTPIPSYFTGPSGPDQWGWLEVFPQHVFRSARGDAEQVTVGVAQNAVDGKLSALSEERSLGRSFHGGTWDTRPDAVSQGLNFQEQWDRALQIDPKCVFITGWNEWVAQRFDTAGRPTFVDQFSQEGSRDVEPMRGGHGDAYYYQMVANIRRYKGVRPIPPLVSRPIRIDGRFNDWAAVQPEYRDFAGDTLHRSHEDWTGAGRLWNATGRNDIVSARVSVDSRTVCFYARTRDPLTAPSGRNWMLLFIDADSSAKTGWLGYDFVVGRGGLRNGTTTLERRVGDRFTGAVRVPAAWRGREMEIAVPRALLGMGTLPRSFDFKWADNVIHANDWTDFYLNGDTAPDARFNYRALPRR